MGIAYSLVASQTTFAMTDHLALEKSFNPNRRKLIVTMNERQNAEQKFPMPGIETLDAEKTNSGWWLLQLQDYDVVRHDDSLL